MWLSIVRRSPHGTRRRGGLTIRSREKTLPGSSDKVLAGGIQRFKSSVYHTEARKAAFIKSLTAGILLLSSRRGLQRRKMFSRGHDFARAVAYRYNHGADFQPGQPVDLFDFGP